MVSLDRFFDRTRSRNYNCWDHSSEVWEHLSGAKLKLGAVLSLSAAKNLRRITAPTSPCIVLMEHPLLEKHVGIFYDGLLLHLAGRGVEYVPLELATRSFRTVRFYQ